MANTTITIAPELVQQAWAKDTWKAGVEQTFFDKFTGTGADSIVQVRTELQKGDGDTINIPLLMKLKGEGVTGDNQLEGNEEALIYRNFKVTIDQLRHAVRLRGKMDEKKTQINMRKDAKMALSYWLANTIDGKILRHSRRTRRKTAYALLVLKLRRAQLRLTTSSQQISLARLSVLLWLIRIR